MHRRHVATLVLALLLVVSGCSGLFGGGATPTPSPQPATPTDAPFTYPSGYSESGVTDAAAAKSAHTDGILSYDSFTFGLTADIGTPNRTVQVDVSWRIDKANDRALLRRSSGDAGEVQYYENDTVYVRTDLPDSDKTFYNSTRRSLQFEDVTGSHFVGPLLKNVTYGSATTVERNGEQLARYESEGLTGRTSFLRDPANVTSFSAELLVDTDGVIRRVQYQATIDRPGGERTLDVSIEVTGLGATTVDRPDWFDRAASS